MTPPADGHEAVEQAEVDAFFRLNEREIGDAETVESMTANFKRRIHEIMNEHGIMDAPDEAKKGKKRLMHNKGGKPIKFKDSLSFSEVQKGLGILLNAPHERLPIEAKQKIKSVILDESASLNRRKNVAEANFTVGKVVTPKATFGAHSLDGNAFDLRQGAEYVVDEINGDEIILKRNNFLMTRYVVRKSDILRFRVLDTAPASTVPGASVAVTPPVSPAPAAAPATPSTAPAPSAPAASPAAPAAVPAAAPSVPVSPSPAPVPVAAPAATVAPSPAPVPVAAPASVPPAVPVAPVARPAAAPVPAAAPESRVKRFGKYMWSFAPAIGLEARLAKSKVAADKTKAKIKKKNDKNKLKKEIEDNYKLVASYKKKKWDDRKAYAAAPFKYVYEKAVNGASSAIETVVVKPTNAIVDNVVKKPISKLWSALDIINPGSDKFWLYDQNKKK